MYKTFFAQCLYDETQDYINLPKHNIQCYLPCRRQTRYKKCRLIIENGMHTDTVWEEQYTAILYKNKPLKSTIQSKIKVDKFKYNNCIFLRFFGGIRLLRNQTADSIRVTICNKNIIGINEDSIWVEKINMVI